MTFVCRALAEVALLEKATTVQHDACLGILAGAVRLLFKAHQLAGEPCSLLT